jgi:maleate isomerase
MRFFPTHRVGIATPSANPAFEHEIRALLPPAVAVHVTRLPVMPGTTLEERNARYMSCYPEALASFGDLALGACAIGLTGPSYALSPHDDVAFQAKLSADRNCPVVLPSRAIADALAALGLRRAVLFSPYQGWLTDRSLAYWQAAGIDVVDVFKVSDTFRAYELSPDEVIAALRRCAAPADAAVIMSGTGMATLDALAACQFERPSLLLPSNLAVAFALVRALGVNPSAAFVEVAPMLARLARIT